MDEVSFNNFKEVDVGMKVLATWYTSNDTYDQVRSFEEKTNGFAEYNYIHKCIYKVSFHFEALQDLLIT